MPYKYFPPDFKLAVATKVLDEGMTIRQACENFDVGRTAVNRWVKKLRMERSGTPEQGKQPLTESVDLPREAVRSRHYPFKQPTSGQQ